MAKKATGAAATGNTKRKASSVKAKSPGRAVARVSPSGGRKTADSGFNASEAFVKLLQSPLMAELVAVAATAVLASLAEHGFTSGNGPRGKRAGRAVKEAGKAAAAAVGRRLSNEFDEIRQASSAAKSGAAA